MNKYLIAMFLMAVCFSQFNAKTHAGSLALSDHSIDTELQSTDWFLGKEINLAQDPDEGDTRDIWEEIQEQNDQYRKELEDIKKKLKDGEIEAACDEDWLRTLLKHIEDTLDLIDECIKNKCHGTTLFQRIMQLGHLLTLIECECKVDFPSFDHDCDDIQS